MSRKAKATKATNAAIEQVATENTMPVQAVEPTTADERLDAAMGAMEQSGIVEQTTDATPDATTDATTDATVEHVVEQDPVAAAVAAHNATLAAPALPNANGIVRASVVVRPVKLVHAIAAGMYAADPAVTRKVVIAACVAQGIATHTARTQYQVWFQAQRNTNATAAAQAQARPNVGRTEPKLESAKA